MSASFKRFRRFIAREDGVVSIEFAFTAIFMVALAVGAFDFGRYAFEVNRVESAARAGTQNAIRSASAAADTDTVEAAARKDLSGYADEYTISARRYCVCAGTEVSCTSNCADGVYAPMYSEVSVIGQYDFLFSYPSVQDPARVAAVSRLRVR